ncbi:MAG: CoA-binding protein [Firmicutes bacterium]|nr:CoA-binding protein [Bacillota bacterium]
MADLRTLFRPKSVAVIGASKVEGKVGNSILKNVINSGFKGDIYPINPKETEIAGLRCYPSISEVKAELAIIVIPTSGVLAAAEECGKSGVRSLIVITAGFKETGSAGAKLERELAEICNRYSMMLVGPNCLGVMDTRTPLDASFAPKFALSGDIAFISQSGALGSAILDWSVTRGLGFSKFISLGNKAGLDETDFIDYLAGDPDTKVIICYIESITGGQRFMDVARAASQVKPVIVFKSGTSAAGARAASSHTGSLAGNDRVYETVFKQCNVMRVKKLDDLFSLAATFTSQPLPRGNRVAILTNAGGPGIITTDNIEASALTMAQFSNRVTEALKVGLPETANIHNPVDVIGDARADRYAYAMEHIMSDENVDSVLVLLTPQTVTQPEETAEALVGIRSRHPGKPVLASFMGGELVGGAVDYLEKSGIATFPFPEPAVNALDGITKYSILRKQIEKEGRERALRPAPDRERVAAIFASVREDSRTNLIGSEAAQVADAYGIPAAPSVLATTVEEAVKAAEKMGYPVVLKLAAPKIQHKTDLGGVKLNIRSADDIRRNFNEIISTVRIKMPNAQISGIEVQKMMPPGREMIIGMSRDPQFGPMIMFGMGGIYVNLLKDVSFRMAYKLTRRQIEDMIKETKAYTLLRGFRGEAPADMDALVDAIARIAQLTLDFPEIAELDINPVFAYEKGLSALDVKIMLAPSKETRKQEVVDSVMPGSAVAQ